METTVSHATSEAEVRDTFGHIPLVPGDTFIKSTIANLSLSDQYLFQRFGQGPITRVPYRCIHHAFEAHAKVNPNAIAASYLGEVITYKELDHQANLLALELIKNGVQKGDNVGLFVQRSIPMLVGILAILKAGGAYVPQHIGLAKDEQLRYVVKSASIKLVLTLSEFKDLVPAINDNKLIVIDDFLKSNTNSNKEIILPSVPVTENDICYIIFTSGTTGDPNGVQVSHGNTCNILLTSPGNLGMRPGLKVGQILSIAFDMSVWEILGSLANGATLVIRGKNIQETVSEVDVVISTPTILSSLDVTRCQNVRVAIVAGEPCPRILAEKWSSFCAFHNSCGPTETTIINTVKRFFPTDELLTIGKPTPNNTVYVLDENLKPCSIGEPGEMWAGGLCVTHGYINNQELTNERYVDDPFLGQGKKMFRTRDLGRWTLDGELEHLGRTDDQVKICGFRVELDSVSSIIEKMPESKRAATLKIDNRTLISFVSPEDIDQEKVKKQVEEVLPYYCVPAIVVAMPELPMTDRGKIDKTKLMNLIPLKQEQEEKTTSSITGQKPVENDEIPNLEMVQLPPQKKSFSRIWKGEKLMHYYRLFALLLIANIGIMIYGATEGNWWSQQEMRLDIISKITLINFTIGILIRQQYIINFLFWVATSIPTSWPLSIRRRAGKIYHFGGIHIGGTISGTLWFIVFMGSLYYDFFNPQNETSKDITLLWVTTMLTGILVFMIIMALPRLRAKFHNSFEKTHRFGGWTALILFWVQTMLILSENGSEQPFLENVFDSFSFWALTVITISIVLPWLRLKKVEVDITRPSNHVILARFNYGETPFAGSSTAISRDPLMEWHSFANVPEPGRDGFRLTISRAGDWTGELIDDMPKYLWVKGITTAGVGNVDKLFKKVIWVATGSGIGPCLPHLFSRETPARLIWATRNPRKTYGDELVEEILESQPEAIIWDTDAHGKPDMVKLAYKAYKDFDAEAVICISNKKLTWKVVYGMESRGIPAYGAIWDS
ncbi:amino acid adenylation domain-containing protein [Aquimarina sp. EL_43]|uniref:amino acid adenylation domain-containing protein n=1 Tax=unclassified Aquimarina TaxID=2627091 RepID=UPI0018CA9080|nr:MULTISPECIES: amino acid adenylation domain-containing protein [unclassified Aquimarina]MBG6129728.1 amino acid adenylation domain-containing protein [Aquimarina sp. EL_35]MBG6150793.1 amino acid adenylation domain-containing protein [Aquimarina sp. EL_32]MBG6167900.1 amino acid adenylation domain-containing protein [Aquimarina sp. EL_43]